MIIRRLVAALGMLALVLTVAAPVRAALMTAGGEMHGMCPLCEADSSPDHTVPKMPLCGIAVCTAAMLQAAPAQLAATQVLTSAEYPTAPGAALSGRTPKAEPPPPRAILAR